MTTLITGGTGFIGAYAARRLAEAGHSLVLLDVAPDPSAVDDVEGDVELVRGDVRDAEAVARTVVEHDVDSVVHLAALLTRSVRRQPVRGVDVNARATARLLELGATLGVDRFVLASTVAVYGVHDPTAPAEAVTEETPLRPTNLYAACKVLSEHLGRVAAEDHDLTVTALRFGTAFGPGRETGASAFTSSLVEGPLAGEAVTVRGRGRPLNWLYVKDAARAIERAAALDGGGFEVLNVASDVAPVEAACEAVRAAIPSAELTVLDETPAEPPWVWPPMDTSRAERVLGFSPAFDLDAAVRDYLDEVRAAGA